MIINKKIYVVYTKNYPVIVLDNIELVKRYMLIMHFLSIGTPTKKCRYKAFNIKVEDAYRNDYVYLEWISPEKYSEPWCVIRRPRLISDSKSKDNDRKIVKRFSIINNNCVSLFPKILISLHLNLRLRVVNIDLNERTLLSNNYTNVDFGLDNDTSWCIGSISGNDIFNEAKTPTEAIHLIRKKIICFINRYLPLLMDCKDFKVDESVFDLKINNYECYSKF